MIGGRAGWYFRLANDGGEEEGVEKELVKDGGRNVIGTTKRGVLE